MTKTPKPANQGPVSLYPLKLDEIVGAVLKIKPPPKPSKKPKRKASAKAR
jgi:hypothetical protein